MPHEGTVSPADVSRDPPWARLPPVAPHRLGRGWGVTGAAGLSCATPVVFAPRGSRPKVGAGGGGRCASCRGLQLGPPPADRGAGARGGIPVGFPAQSPRGGGSRSVSRGQTPAGSGQSR